MDLKAFDLAAESLRTEASENMAQGNNSGNPFGSRTVEWVGGKGSPRRVTSFSQPGNDYFLKNLKNLFWSTNYLIKCVTYSGLFFLLNS